MFVSMDACFSLVKKGSDSAKICPLHEDKFFVAQDAVDEFVREYGVKTEKPNIGVSMNNFAEPRTISASNLSLMWCS